RAKELRNNPTEVEKKLWQYLRKSQLARYKFRRQQPIGPYIVDFFSSDAGLIIELDGGQHAENIEYDKKRTEFLQAQGYSVLRFWNNNITENIEGVYEAVLNVLKEAPPPTPSLKGRGESECDPLPQGERGLVVLLT